MSTEYSIDLAGLIRLSAFFVILLTTVSVSVSLPALAETTESCFRIPADSFTDPWNRPAWSRLPTELELGRDPFVPQLISLADIRHLPANEARRFEDPPATAFSTAVSGEVYAVPVHREVSEVLRLELAEEARSESGSQPQVGWLNWSDSLPIDCFHTEIEPGFLPRSIHHQDGLLYVLLKKDSPNALPSWKVVKLQVRVNSASVLGVMTLPSSAEELNVYPLTDTWIAREQSSPSSARSESSLLFLPRAWFKDSTSSPLSGPGAEAIQCEDLLAIEATKLLAQR